MRINKFLADAGVASRRKAESFVLDGKVKINGNIVTELATDVTENDVVMLDGKVISAKQNLEYYVLNKPKGYLSTASDDRGRKTVLDLVKSNQRIYPVGRLDYDSEGLLILTNDGDLTNKLTHPKHNISKTYLVNINSLITKKQIETLQNGVVIDGYKLHKCEIKILDESDNQTKLEIVIHEGRNREIRKMFESIGKKVVFLKRIKIENFSLGNLKRGEYRPLSSNEIEYLKNL